MYILVQYVKYINLVVSMYFGKQCHQRELIKSKYGVQLTKRPLISSWWAFPHE